MGNRHLLVQKNKQKKKQELAPHIHIHTQKLQIIIVYIYVDVDKTEKTHQELRTVGKGTSQHKTAYTPHGTGHKGHTYAIN